MRIFEEPPDGLDETWTNGVLVGGMASPLDPMELARAYRAAAEALIPAALTSGEEWRFTYPLLYLFRHALELYFKEMVKPEKLSHDLRPRLKGLESIVRDRYHQGIPPDLHADLTVLVEMDPDGQGFRYSQTRKGEAQWLPGEYWIDLRTLGTRMNVLCDALEKIIHDR